MGGFVSPRGWVCFPSQGTIFVQNSLAQVILRGGTRLEFRPAKKPQLQGQPQHSGGCAGRGVPGRQGSPSWERVGFWGRGVGVGAVGWVHAPSSPAAASAALDWPCWHRAPSCARYPAFLVVCLLVDVGLELIRELLRVRPLRVSKPQNTVL